MTHQIAIDGGNLVSIEVLTSDYSCIQYDKGSSEQRARICLVAYLKARQTSKVANVKCLVPFPGGMLMQLMKKPIITILVIVATSVLNACGGGGGGVGSSGDDSSGTSTIATPGPVILTRANVIYTDTSHVYDLIVSPDAGHAYYRTGARNSDTQNIGCLAWDLNDLNYTSSASCNLSLDASPKAIDMQGHTLYATDNSSTDPRLIVLRIDSNSGVLNQIQEINFRSLSSANFFPGKVVVRPDNAFVYVTNVVANDIAVFSRKSDGSLAFVQIQNLQGIVDAEVIFSQTGNLLLAGSKDRVTSFLADPVTGALTNADSFGAIGAHGWSDGLLDSFSSFAFSQDGTEIYVYGIFRIRAMSGLFEGQKAVVNLAIDANGAFTYKYHLALAPTGTSGGSIGDIAVNFDDDKIYVTSYQQNNLKYPTIQAYTLVKIGDTAFQIAQQLNLDSMQGPFAPTMEFIPAHGKILVTAKYNGGGISTLSLDVGGDIVDEEMLSLSDYEFEGLGRVVNVVATRDSKYVYSLSTAPPGSGNGDYTLNLYRYANTTGTHSLQKLDSVRFPSKDHVTNEFLPGSIALAPDEQHLYVLGETTSCALMGYALDSVTGNMTKLSFGINEQFLFSDCLSVFSVTLSNDGLNLYASYLNNAGNIAISVLQRDTGTGDLAESFSYDLGIPGAGVSRFRMKPFIQLSNSGELLYFFYKGVALVAHFSRDKVTGELTSESALQDSDLDIEGNLIDGLIEVSDSAISKTDEYLYVSSDEIYVAVSPFTGLQTNNVGINVFRIYPVSGQLVSVQKIDRPKFPNILGGYRSILLSPDGSYLFAIVGRQRTPFESMDENAHGVDVYEVDTISGQLSFMQRIEDPILDRGTRKLFPIGSIVNGLIVANERNDSLGFFNY